MNEDSTKNGPNEDPDDDLRPEYDFFTLPGGIRGKHSDRFPSGTTLIALDEDVAKAFPTAAAVNEALRLLIDIANRQNP